MKTLINDRMSDSYYQKSNIEKITNSEIDENFSVFEKLNSESEEENNKKI